MLLLLVALVYLVACREPLCYEGSVYRANTQPWSQVASPTRPSKCYFHIEFKMDSLVSCSFDRIVVTLGHEAEGSRTNKYGNCSFVEPYFSSPYLRCQCAGSYCNSRLQKILPIFEDFRQSMSNDSETTVARDLLNCIQYELETLGLLPTREAIGQGEQSTVVSFFERHEIYGIIGLCLLLILIILVILLLVFNFTREPRRAERCHYECWNVMDPTDRGTFLPSRSIPSMSRETVKPGEEEEEN